ncbi:MAG: hypothetical protein VCC01_07320, partial [Candidatus Hydrogenedentota bacterium]
VAQRDDLGIFLVEKTLQINIRAVITHADDANGDSIARRNPPSAPRAEDGMMVGAATTAAPVVAAAFKNLRRVRIRLLILCSPASDLIGSHNVSLSAPITKLSTIQHTSR